MKKIDKALLTFLMFAQTARIETKWLWKQSLKHKLQINRKTITLLYINSIEKKLRTVQSIRQKQRNYLKRTICHILSNGSFNNSYEITALLQSTNPAYFS